MRGNTKNFDAAGLVVSHSYIDTGGGDIVGRDKIDANNIFMGPAFFAPMPAPSISRDGVGLRRPPRLLPYLTDRTEQQRHLTAAIQRQFDQGSNRPMTFFVVGRDDECLDSFVEQIRYVRLPTILQSNDLPPDILYRSLQWISNETLSELSNEDIEQQLFDVKSQVHDALGLKMSTNNLAIEQKLSSCPGSCVFHVGLAIADWNTTQAKVMATWTQWLRTLELSKVRTPILTLITIVYPSSFLSGVWWRRAISALGRDVRALANSETSDVDVCYLPELESVRFDDVEQWIREYVENVDREVFRRLVRQHFSYRFGFGQRKLSMYRAAAVVKAALIDPSVQMSNQI
jgi:hypothetical protein